ncbi:MAG: hypothetical protein AB8B72_07760 [Crocinitomicaceae bacterium]
MTLKELILSDNSKTVWEAVADRALKSTDDLELLMDYFESTDIRLVQRATQSISKVHDRNKAILRPYFVRMIKGLSEPRIDAYKRNVMRIFQTADIPEEYEGHLFDKAFTYLEDKNEAIAIRAFSMTVCRKVAERHPDLAPEIIDAIKYLMEETAATGLLNRGKHELIKLKKLI